MSPVGLVEATASLTWLIQLALALIASSRAATVSPRLREVAGTVLGERGNLAGCKGGLPDRASSRAPASLSQRAAASGGTTWWALP